MGIEHGDPQVGVAEDLLQGQDAAAGHDEVRREGVAQRVPWPRQGTDARLPHKAREPSYIKDPQRTIEHLSHPRRLRPPWAKRTFVATMRSGHLTCAVFMRLPAPCTDQVGRPSSGSFPLLFRCGRAGKL